VAAAATLPENGEGSKNQRVTITVAPRRVRL